MSKSSPPLTRVRGKSAPRAKSPDPRSLKKAAKALVTPPSSSSSKKKSKDKVQRKLSFGAVSETPIVAENPPGDSSASAARKADQAVLIPTVPRRTKRPNARRQRTRKALAQMSLARTLGIAGGGGKGLNGQACI